MPTEHLDGVAFVTGAGSGIGRETCFRLAECGAIAVAFIDINETAASDAAEESKTLATNSKYQTLVIGVNVTDEQAVESAVSKVIEMFTRIDYGVICTGISQPQYLPLHETSLEEFEKVMQVNTSGGFICTRALCRAMRTQSPRNIITRHGIRDVGRGSVVNVLSAMAYAAIHGKISYTSSKHALLGMTKCAALEYASMGIRVNAVCPTWVRTPWLDSEQAKTPSIPDYIKRACPLGRPAEPDEVADVILALSSVGFSYVTGTGLIVDAGYTLSMHTS